MDVDALKKIYNNRPMIGSPACEKITASILVPGMVRRWAVDWRGSSYLVSINVDVVQKATSCWYTYLSGKKYESPTLDGVRYMCSI